MISSFLTHLKLADDLLASQKLNLLTPIGRARVEEQIQMLGRVWASRFLLKNASKFKYKKYAAEKEEFENAVIFISAPSADVNHTATIKSLRQESAALAAEVAEHKANLAALKSVAEDFITAVDKVQCSCPTAKGAAEHPVFEKMVCDCSPSSQARLDDVVGQQVRTLSCQCIV